jgi:NAD(P)H-hydrate epimerase
MTGAAALCSEAALRAGAGLVTLGIPRSLNPILEVKLTEAMTLPLAETPSGGHSAASLPEVLERLKGAGAGAIGPGLGREDAGAELVRGVLKEAGCPLVVDADGLAAISDTQLRNPLSTVITPHPGEIARLLGTTVEAVQSNRIGTARDAAARFGCVVVLKGAATVVAAPDGRIGVNSSGSPALATGGTGDVLTGVVAACLARGLEAYEAAAAAVFLHGLAGEVAEERWGAPGALAGDVLAALPEALRRLRMGEVPLPCRMI